MVSRRQFNIGALFLGSGLLSLNPSTANAQVRAGGDTVNPEDLDPRGNSNSVLVQEESRFFSLTFPGNSTLIESPDFSVMSALVVFTHADNTKERVSVPPSPHCRDGVFDLTSELITIPDGVVSVEIANISSSVRSMPATSTRSVKQPTQVFVHPSGSSSSDFIEYSARSAADSSSMSSSLNSSSQKKKLTPRAEVCNGLKVLSRDQWGADESLMTWDVESSPAQCITVHHTAIPTGDEPEYQHDWPAAVRSIYRFHASSDNGGRGWGDIGYHLLIDPQGTIYQGRATGRKNQAVFASQDEPLKSVTAGHVFKANTGNIGVCLIGNFENHKPTDAALESLNRVLSVLCDALELDPEGTVNYTNEASKVNITMPSISGHRDWEKVSSATECPGEHLWDLLPEIRETVAKNAN